MMLSLIMCGKGGVREMQRFQIYLILNDFMVTWFRNGSPKLSENVIKIDIEKVGIEEWESDRGGEEWK